MRSDVLFKTIFLGTFIFLSGISIASSQSTLRVAVDTSYPPFTFVDEAGILTGFDVDIANALCREIKKKCTIIPVTFEEIIPAISAGKIDFAVAGIGKTAEREKLVDFTDRYYHSHSIFISKLDEALTTIRAENLDGKRIGVQSGTVQEDYLKEMYGTEVILKTWPHFDQLFEALKRKEIDLVFVDGLAGYAYLKSIGGNEMETVGSPIPSAPAQAENQNETRTNLQLSSIAVSKKMPDLRNEIDAAIQTIRQNGEYGKINRKYFEFDIY